MAGGRERVWRETERYSCRVRFAATAGSHKRTQPYASKRSPLHHAQNSARPSAGALLSTAATI